MSSVNSIQLVRRPNGGRTVPGGEPSVLAQYRAQLEIAEAELRAALDEAGRAAAAIRGVEAEMRHLWDLCHGDPQPTVQERLERLRNQRAALAEQKHNAQRTSEEAGLKLASARRAIDATEERARRLGRQLRQENDEARRVRRAIAAAEQSLAGQREVLQVREALLNSLREELRHLTGEVLA